MNKKNILIGLGLLAAVLIVLFWDKIAEVAKGASGKISNLSAGVVIPAPPKNAPETTVKNQGKILSDKLKVKSGEVIELQKLLNEMLPTSPLVVDGLFGPLTKKKLSVAFLKITGQAQYSTTLSHFKDSVYNEWAKK